MATKTQTAASTAPTLGTLAARRAHAEAALEAADAQTRAAQAQIEARAAEEELERRHAQARWAAAAAQVDEMDRYVKEQREREYREWNQEYDKRQEMMQQLRALRDEPLPHVRRSMEEYQAELAQLDAYVDRAAQAERDRDKAYIDRAESERLWNHAFRARYDFHHPGGLAACSCTMHRRYRGEE